MLFEKLAKTRLKPFLLLLKSNLWIKFDIKDFSISSSCLGYDVELIWRQQGNDIVSLAAICTTTVNFVVFFTRPAA